MARGAWSTKDDWNTKSAKATRKTRNRLSWLPRSFVPFVFQTLFALFVLQTFLAPLVLANGGTVQVANHPAGPYALTVFTSPNPIRVGTVDVSVLAQHAGSEKLVPEARVIVTAEQADRPAERRSFEANHGQATNKLYYAANLELPREGRWRIGVEVSGVEGEGAVSFEVEAAEADPLDNPLRLALLLGVPLLLGAIWLWRSGSSAPRPAGGEKG